MWRRCRAEGAAIIGHVVVIAIADVAIETLPAVGAVVAAVLVALGRAHTAKEVVAPVAFLAAKGRNVTV